MVIEVSNLAAGYSDDPVVSGVTFSVSKGEVLGMIGANGAGKSTIVRAINGRCKIFAGEVKVFGRVQERLTPFDMFAQGIVFLPQGGRVFEGLSVEENISLVRALTRRATKIHGSRRIRSGDSEAHIHKELCGRMAAVNLSGGEKQLLSLQMALAAEPRLLLLDEPTLGLASGASRKVVEELQALVEGEGIALVLVEQRLDVVAKLASRVLVVKNGQQVFLGDWQEWSSREGLQELLL